jgi:ubiquinone/menaquinone biosynthesis C-methylase UbiE
MWHAHLMGLEETLAGQIAYYRGRAPEYDKTSLGDTEQSSRRFAEIIKRLGPTGEVLEIACGTGLWTQHIVGQAARLTALDSSPEMIELAKARLGGRTAAFVDADVFAWQPDRLYDNVFFGFWLSHVPPQRFRSFWDLLQRSLAPGGRVLFVDEGTSRAVNEPAAASSSVVPRRLRDGTIHKIVKIFYDSEELGHKLAVLGWSSEIELTTEGLLVGKARITPPWLAARSGPRRGRS